MRPGVRYWRRRARTSSRDGPVYEAGRCGESGRETLRVEVLACCAPDSIAVAAPLVAITGSSYRNRISVNYGGSFRASREHRSSPVDDPERIARRYALRGLSR